MQTMPLVWRPLRGIWSSFSNLSLSTGASLNLSKTQGLKLGSFVGRKLKGNIDWGESQMVINEICSGNCNYIHMFWQGLFQKAKRKLEAWSSRILTFIGKINIINSCIFSLFYYVAPVYIYTGQCFLDRGPSTGFSVYLEEADGVG